MPAMASGWRVWSNRADSPPMSIDGSAWTRQVTLPGPNRPGSPGGSVYCSNGRRSAASVRMIGARSCCWSAPPINGTWPSDGIPTMTMSLPHHREIAAPSHACQVR